jgi:hypothetical protein
MTPRQARKDSKTSNERLKGRQENNQGQARKDSKADREDSKEGNKILQGRQGKTRRQARKDSKAG